MKVEIDHGPRITDQRERGENRTAPLTAYQQFGFLGGKGAPWG